MEELRPKKAGQFPLVSVLSVLEPGSQPSSFFASFHEGGTLAIWREDSSASLGWTMQAKLIPVFSSPLKPSRTSWTPA